MFQESKKLQNSFSLPKLGIGTAHIGGNTREADSSTDTQSIKAVRTALDLGYTHIDTAALYAAGHTEELVGQAIEHYDRSKLCISTKVWKDELTYDAVIRSAHKSLVRLKTTYLDILSVHAPNPNIPLSETFSALDTLIEEGLVRHVGVSNFNVPLLTEALKTTKHKITTNQIEYNLIVRNKSHFHGLTNMESEIIPFCTNRGITITSCVPLARGAILKKCLLMDELSIKYNKSYAQIALNWLISQKNIAAVVKAENEEHLKENLGCLGWNLSKSDILRLKNEYPFKHSLPQ